MTIKEEVIFKIKSDIASAELREIRGGYKYNNLIKNLKKELELAKKGDKHTLNTWKGLYI